MKMAARLQSAAVLQQYVASDVLFAACCHARFCLPYSPTQKIEATYTSKSYANVQQATRRHIPEDSKFHTDLYVNMKL
jgi:hypothetical protein